MTPREHVPDADWNWSRKPSIFKNQADAPIRKALVSKLG
jgi:hypothetical protein